MPEIIKLNEHLIVLIEEDTEEEPLESNIRFYGRYIAGLLLTSFILYAIFH